MQNEEPYTTWILRIRLKRGGEGGRHTPGIVVHTDFLGVYLALLTEFGCGKSFSEGRPDT